jgi:hypothetical protein
MDPGNDALFAHQQAVILRSVFVMFFIVAAQKVVLAFATVPQNALHQDLFCLFSVGIGRTPRLTHAHSAGPMGSASGPQTLADERRRPFSARGMGAKTLPWPESLCNIARSGHVRGAFVAMI